MLEPQWSIAKSINDVAGLRNEELQDERGAGSGELGVGSWELGVGSGEEIDNFIAKIKRESYLRSLRLDKFH
jgi:hypothetical protein